MEKQMKWGLATLMLLLGIAAVFLFIDKDTETKPKYTLGQQTKDLLKQDVKSPQQAETPGAEKRQPPPGTSATTQDTNITTAEKPPPKMSPFGLGPYPEIPEKMNAPYLWEGCQTLEDELLTRVIIKMHNEGIRDKYSSVGINHGTGLIIPIEYGSILVEYETDENGEQIICSVEGHPDDVPPGIIYTHASEIPSHLKIVTVDEIAINPHEYLNIEK